MEVGDGTIWRPKLRDLAFVRRPVIKIGQTIAFGPIPKEGTTWW